MPLYEQPQNGLNRVAMMIPISRSARAPLRELTPPPGICEELTTDEEFLKQGGYSLGAEGGNRLQKR